MDSEESKLKEKVLEVIREWKFFWMNQKQNSQADYENYHRRAFSIDANMKHHLAKMISDKFVEKSAYGELIEDVKKLSEQYQELISFLDTEIASIPANSRQRDLDEETWSELMHQRDVGMKAIGDLKEKHSLEKV